MRLRLASAAFALALLVARASAQGSMFIESCSLGCSSGQGAPSVSCAFGAIAPNDELRVRFSRPVDPASVSVTSFLIFDVATGLTPTGTRYVDPVDPQVVVFEPSLAFDAAGNPHFGFAPSTTYVVRIDGLLASDPGPFITSLDVPPLPNESRMDCTIVTAATAETLGTPLCASPATACPCGNAGSLGRGCANSQAGSLGALLFGLGAPDETAVLYATGEPASALTIFLQGTAAVPAGAPFGDGVLCVGGTSVALAVKPAFAGIAVYPGPGDASIPAQSAAHGDPLTPGSVRWYQAYYRDPSPSFCTPPQGSTFNVGPALEITW